MPYDWQGEVDLELRAAGGLPVVLRPRVIGNAEAWRVERQGAAISATIYASLFTLALLALALFSAARDRLFMTLFGCATDRQRVVSGKSVSVRVDLGGRRLIKKKTIQRTVTKQ